MTIIFSVISMFPCPLSCRLEIVDGDCPDILVQCQTNPELDRIFWMINSLEKANTTVFGRVMNAASAFYKGIQENLLLRANLLESQEDLTTMKTITPIDYDLSELNETQKNAVNGALTSDLTLIQGPPGTGKTKVACTIINCVSQHPDRKKILALAETNTAVDNITRRLSQMNVPLVRVGNSKQVPSDLFHLTLDGQIRIKCDKEAKSDTFKGKGGKQVRKKNIVKQIIEDAKVILTTSAGAYDPCLLDVDFRFVIS